MTDPMTPKGLTPRQHLAAEFRKAADAIDRGEQACIDLGDDEYVFNVDGPFVSTYVLRPTGDKSNEIASDVLTLADWLEH